MNKIHIEEKYIFEYMKDNIYSLKRESLNVQNARYHHNTDYKDASNIVKHGILSIKELNQTGIKKFSEGVLNIADDIDSHVNGNDGISLSVVGLTDLYSNESEYDPFNHISVDFLIDSNIKAYRSTTNYGNEYITKNKILPNNFRSIDVRLLKYIDCLEKSSLISNKDEIEKLIDKYNNLNLIANAIKDAELDIPIREMSTSENVTLDMDKLSKEPTLILKK